MRLLRGWECGRRVDLGDGSVRENSRGADASSALGVSSVPQAVANKGGWIELLLEKFSGRCAMRSPGEGW